MAYWPHSNPEPPPTEPELTCFCLTCRDDCKRIHRERVCQPCRRRIRDHLADLPGQYQSLTGLLEPGSSASQRVSGSRTPPAPVRMAALSLLGRQRGSTDSVHEDIDPRTGKPYGDQHGPTSIADTLFLIERSWREADPTRFSAGAAFLGSAQQTVTALSGFLVAQLDWACDHHEAIAEDATDLRQLRHAIRTVLDDWDGDRHLTDVECPDPDCDMRTLVLRAGSNYVECTTCEFLWTEAELEHLGLVLTEGAA